MGHHWTPVSSLLPLTLSLCFHVRGTRGTALRYVTRELLAQLGMTPAGVDYALSRKGAVIWADVATFSIRDRSDARVVRDGFEAHMLGIKLLDDLVDQDVACEDADLLAGTHLLNVGFARLSDAQHGRLCIQLLERRFRPIYAFVANELRAPPDSFERWFDLAVVKGGALFGSYCEAAVIGAGGSDSEATEAGRLGHCLGVLLMIRDDVRDSVEKREVRGNLVSVYDASHASDFQARIDAHANEARTIVEGGRISPDVVRILDDVLHDIAQRREALRL